VAAAASPLGSFVLREERKTSQLCFYFGCFLVHHFIMIEFHFL
jgi:hypothetical protein